MGYDERIGFQFLHPGPGYGGSCFPKDVAALLHTARAAGYDFELLAGVGEVNQAQHDRIVDKIARAAGGADATTTNADTVIAVWGLTFKAETDDLRDSPSIAIARRLCDTGATVRAFDPAAGRAGAPAGAATRDLCRRVRRRRRSRRAWPCSRSGTSSVGWTSRASGTRCGSRPSWMLVIFSIRRPCAGSALHTTGWVADESCHNRRCRVPRVAPVPQLPRARRRSRRRRQPVHGVARRTSPSSKAEPGLRTGARGRVARDPGVAGAIDGVLHFASPASPPEYLEMPLETMDVGSLGTRNALDLARANDARFLVASTSEIYGDPHVHPQTEDYNGNVDPTGPRAVYDEAKRFAETLTMTYHRQFAVNTAIVRIFNTYGPRLRPADGRVVSNFLAQAAEGKPLTIYGDGSQTRSFCYVDDEVRGLVALFDSDVVDPVNIGNPDEYTMLELADVVREVTSSASEIVFEPLPIGDPTQRQPDITRARELLGWEPEIPLREGLAPHARVVRRGTCPWRSVISAHRRSCASSRWSCRSSTSATPWSRSCAACATSSCRTPSSGRSSSSTTAATTAPATCSRQLGDSTVRVIMHEHNRGKGAAVRTGFEHATGDYVLVQDADLEYDPEDWPRLLAPVLSGKARVVYGSRFTGERRNMLFFHWVGNRFLSLTTNVLYNTTLSDMETCYKLIDRKLLEQLRACSRTASTSSPRSRRRS